MGQLILSADNINHAYVCLTVVLLSQRLYLARVLSTMIAIKVYNYFIETPARKETVYGLLMLSYAKSYIMITLSISLFVY